MATKNWVIVGMMAALVAVAGCGDRMNLVEIENVDRVGVYRQWLSSDLHAEDALEFVHVDEMAPPLETYRASFWAVYGEERELKIRFKPKDNSWYPPDPFLEFEVGRGTLYRWPHGKRFEPGDSVLITVSVDPDRYLATFEPAGLLFDAEYPAELEIHYGHADAESQTREREFEIWRQERSGDPWARVGGVRTEESDEIEATLFGFTRYALAIGGR